MGSDLIIAHIWTTKSDEELRWEVVEAAIAALTTDDLNDEESFYDYEDPPEDPEEFLSKLVRPVLLDDFETFKRYWQSRGRDLPRDVDICTLGPVRAMIAGGMSWGDSPTESFDMLNRLPTKILQAIGFLNE